MTEEQSKNKPEALLRHLSAEDLELVNTSDDELWKRSSVFSFDLQECQARVTRGEKWHQLIQAHLYLEHVLTMLMTDALADPGAIGASRMAFAQKLNMIRAMGLLSVENVSTLIKINKLRNKIAHDLTFSITDESERDLINATSDNFKASVMSDDKRTSGPIRFEEVLYIAILHCEVQRHHLAYMRLINKKNMFQVYKGLESLGVVKIQWNRFITWDSRPCLGDVAWGDDRR